MSEPEAAEVQVDELCSYAVDVWVRDPAILVDEPVLLDLLRSAAIAGNATILGETGHIFPNGAVTAVLVLSQSHLSIHTWPEFSLANIDLLAYGRLNAELMLEKIEKGLNPTRINVSRLLRAIH
ncbi:MULTISPECIES: S-adenosylmethionine decarboxylase family protein [unclassified Crossiella]|uniref:S-adenosylmethionine decarboxylase family protein n=1 Tax=unclassified Crossiella TaxID=2620835 RepID=UPI001FFE6EE0|nr:MULTISPECIES: S-adenosylmethionine decarboxylase [unclassified Crossiella]MCK2239168.1 S-adenosylmethionine decarboxylase [Crossiella sp. S99.2]MCK2251263.1 S-adenosylmethionine decarboxylase [Crossiella sp. S99.1]